MFLTFSRVFALKCKTFLNKNFSEYIYADNI